MKKPEPHPTASEMRGEYDFSKGVRGKYAKAYARGSNIVVLDPDVAALFPDSKAVNDILRAIVRVASKHAANPPKSTRSPIKKRQ